MIQPDAKCVNNGKKLNETIKGLNSILNNVVSEEIDIVDSNNQPSKRWFVVGKLTGQKQDSGTGDRDNLGNTPSNKNRDKLTTGGTPLGNGAGVAPTGNISTGRPAGDLVDDGMTAKQAGANFLKNKQRAGSANMISVGGAGVDEFGNTIGGSGRGDLADDGMTAKQAGANFLANRQRAAGTTPAPLPGAPPLGGDTTPSPSPVAPAPLPIEPAPLPVEQSPNQPTTSTQADAAPPSSAANTNITKMEDELRIAQERLRRLKRTNDYDAPIIKSQQRLVDELKRQVAAARA